MQPRIAFVRFGSFSNCNPNIERILRESFPRAAIDDMDMERSLGMRVARRAIDAVLRWRHADARRRIPTAARSAAFFRVTRRAALSQLGRQPYLFTLQSQSFYDAHRSATPHFVYTDHTQMANLRYPAFNAADLAAPAWIACERSIYSAATCNFTMSGNIARSIVDDYGCPQEQVEVVGVGPGMPIVLQGPPDYDAQRVLFVGVEWERKGGPQLLQAFQRVRARHPRATLEVVGCSPAIDAAGVRVVGRVPRERVPEFYRNASIFCLPTLIEPFGFVFIEAMAAGLPIVGTRIGALPELITDGHNGLIVAPNDVEQLERALDRLLGSATACRDMGVAGQAIARSRYSWDAVARAMTAAIVSRVPAAAAAR